MPNTNQHADSTMAVIEDELWHQRRQAARRVVHAFAEVKEWPEEDIVQVIGALGLDKDR